MNRSVGSPWTRSAVEVRGPGISVFRLPALGAASLHFRSICEEDLDESFEQLVDSY